MFFNFPQSKPNFFLRSGFVLLSLFALLSCGDNSIVNGTPDASNLQAQKLANCEAEMTKREGSAFTINIMAVSNKRNIAYGDEPYITDSGLSPDGGFFAFQYLSNQAFINLAHIHTNDITYAQYLAFRGNTIYPIFIFSEKSVTNLPLYTKTEYPLKSAKDYNGNLPLKDHGKTTVVKCSDDLFVYQLNRTPTGYYAYSISEIDF